MAKSKHKRFYQSYFVSPDITNRQPTRPVETSPQVISALYKRANIRYFSSKEEFIDYLSHTSLSLATKAEYWEQYKARDLLIRSGEYEDIKADMFKEQYIKAMEARAEENGIVDYSKLATKISLLTTDEFLDIADALPDLSAYYLASDYMSTVPPGENRSNYDILMDLVDYKLEPDEPTISKSKKLNPARTIYSRAKASKIKPRISSLGSIYFPFVKKKYQNIAMRGYLDRNKTSE